jgi:hypothetical protein
MDVHDHIKFLKHGYSKVTDHACREIRYGRLNREQALGLVSHHEAQPMAHLDKFCDWLGVDFKALSFIFNQHRSPKVWDESAPGKWHRQSGSDFTRGYAPYLTDSGFLGFDAHTNLFMDDSDEYVTVGKGYPL